MSTLTIVRQIRTGETVIDVIMQAAERASGVLEMVLQRLINDPETDLDLYHALCAANREMMDIQAITEAHQNGEYDQPERHLAEAKPASFANLAETSPEVSILAKLIKFAEITAEQAAGIDAELKKYRAAAAAPAGVGQPGTGGVK